MGCLGISSDFTLNFHFHALEKEMATHSSILAWRIRDGGTWRAAVYGVTQSQTRMKRLSSSSSSNRKADEKDPKGKKVNIKVLLYGTRNCIQLPVINHNGKEYDTVSCITVLFCCISETNKTL